MKNLSRKLAVRKSGLTPTQSDAAKHFKKNPDEANFPVRVVDALTFLKIMAAFLLTLTRPVRDQIFRATFMSVKSWDECVLWQDDPALDGYAPSHAMRRLWEYFTGTSVPKGAVIHHACHDKDTCADGIFCTHRMCVNPLHFYLTTPTGVSSRSHNATQRDRLTKKKIPEYMKYWTTDKYGHDTEPGSGIL